MLYDYITEFTCPLPYNNMLYDYITELTCSIPVPPQNAHNVSHSGQAIDEYIIYKCDAGYIIMDSNPVATTFNVTCDLQEDIVNANWSALAVCVGKFILLPLCNGRLLTCVQSHFMNCVYNSVNTMSTMLINVYKIWRRTLQAYKRN
jgi:hypothetical protein